MKLSSGLPLLILFSSTCLDYELVGPASPAEPVLHVSVEVSNSESLTLELFGSFTTGTHAGTTKRVLADSTMLFQHSVTAPQIQDASHLRYAWIAHYFGDPAGPDSARLRGPIVSENAPPPMIAFPVPRRLQPFRLEHAVGADLILELSPTAAPEQLNRISGFWLLEFEIEVEGETRRALSLDGGLLTPSRLHVPWAWLEQSVASGDTLSATLSMFDDFEVMASPYRTHVSRHAQLFWRIILVPAP